MLYTLNIYSDACQFYVNKTGGKAEYQRSGGLTKKKIEELRKVFLKSMTEYCSAYA